MSTENEFQILIDIKKYLSEGYDKKTILAVIRSKYGGSADDLKVLIEGEINQRIGTESPKNTKNNKSTDHNSQKKSGSSPEWFSKDIENLNQSRKKPILLWVFFILLLVAVIVTLSVLFVRGVERGKNITDLEMQIPLFTDLADSAVYYIYVGSSEVKEGFEKYLDEVKKYANYRYQSADIDKILKPYIRSAEFDWDSAESNLNAMQIIMKKLKPILKPSIYEKFVEIYSAIKEYKQSVSPYGKNADDYKQYTTDYEIKITREMANFKSYIDDYEELLK